jgi:hypothetical protein
MDGVNRMNTMNRMDPMAGILFILPILFEGPGFCYSKLRAGLQGTPSCSA